MANDLYKIIEEQNKDFEVESSTGYSLWITKVFRPKQKSYCLLIAEKGSNHFKQIGTIKDPVLFKKVLTGKEVK